MAKYSKETPRVTVRIINADTDEQLGEINDRNWMNVGELFSGGIANSIIMGELKDKKLPKSVLILAVGEYFLEN